MSLGEGGGGGVGVGGGRGVEGMPWKGGGGAKKLEFRGLVASGCTRWEENKGASIVVWDLVCNVHIVNMGSQFILQHNYSQIQLIGKYNRLYCKALIVNCPIGGLSCIASPCL